jgi:hypothetical protein
MTEWTLSSNPAPNIKECLYILAICGVTIACFSAWWIYKLYLRRRAQLSSVDDQGSEEMETLRFQLSSSTTVVDEKEEQPQSPIGDTVQQPSLTSRPMYLKMICPHCKQISTGIISAAQLESKASNAQSFASKFIWTATLTMGAYIIYKLSNEPTS